MKEIQIHDHISHAFCFMASALSNDSNSARTSPMINANCANVLSLSSVKLKAKRIKNL